MLPIGPKCIIHQLVLLRLGFLNTHHIGVLFGQLFEEALALRGPNTIGITHNNSKHATQSCLMS